MSCSYADGLSPYSNKGVLGVPEKFDDAEKLEEKCTLLAEWIEKANHVVVHTGAGISTSAGIPDFRGPNGVWTLEKEGKRPEISISFNDAIPTKTHMALKYLVDKHYVSYVISQNIDGLHLRSGLPRKCIAELHGNMFTGQCNTCESQFVRASATTSVGQKCLEEGCKRYAIQKRVCRGKLHDTILDWEDSLPRYDLEMSDYHASVADLNICLGTTLQIVPSGNLPLRCKKYGGKVVIVNLQPTKHDKKADLVINYFVDEVMSKVMKFLCLKIPEYLPQMDPTKNQLLNSVIEWNISKKDIRHAEKRYNSVVREFKKRKSAREALLGEVDVIPKKLKKEFAESKEFVISEIKKEQIKTDVDFLLENKDCIKPVLKKDELSITVDLTEDDDDDDIFIE